LNKLKAANIVHIIEPQWNPSVENQAIGRIIRLGQEKAVKIVRYIMKGSVEEVHYDCATLKEYFLIFIRLSNHASCANSNLRAEDSAFPKRITAKDELMRLWYVKKVTHFSIVYLLKGISEFDLPFGLAKQAHRRRILCPRGAVWNFSYPIE
jgi:hypothetical protein